MCPTSIIFFTVFAASNSRLTASYTLTCALHCTYICYYMTIHIIFKQNLTLYTVQYICSKNKFAVVLHNIETLSHFHMPNRPKKCVSYTPTLSKDGSHLHQEVKLK